MTVDEVARETLEARGVEVRTGAQVARVRSDRVLLADGEELAAHTLVWAAGVQAEPVSMAAIEATLAAAMENVRTLLAQLFKEFSNDPT